jgi:hypothetical protein
MIESILSVIFGLMLSCLSIILSKREGRFDLFAPPHDCDRNNVVAIFLARLYPPLF